MENKDKLKRLNEIEDEKYKLANDLKYAKRNQDFSTYNYSKTKIGKLKFEELKLRKELGDNNTIGSNPYEWPITSNSRLRVSTRTTRRGTGAWEIIDNYVNGNPHDLITNGIDPARDVPHTRTRLSERQLVELNNELDRLRNTNEPPPLLE